MKQIALLFLFLGFVMPCLSQNLPPVAVNDTITASPGDTVYVNVLKNDYDPEGDSIWAGSFSSGDSIIVLYFNYAEYSYFKPGYLSKPYILHDEHSNHSFGEIIIQYQNPLFDSININNINASINGSGNHFWGYYGNNGRFPLFKVPNGQKTATISNFVPWIGGLDEQDQLHASAEQFYGLEDFRPGPISLVYDGSYRQKWYRVWGITKNEIEYHKTHYLDPGYTADSVILTWPGNGDESLGQSALIAPFHDLDQDSNYEPLEGDYPVISGDKAVFFIFNDDFFSEYGSNGIPLGVEVHGMAFAFDCPGDSALQNTIFMTQKFINRSDTNYHDLYLGFFTNWQLGDRYDNRTGCDTSLNSWFAYNGSAWDDTAMNGYGHHPPSQGITFLNHNLDHFMLCDGASITECPWGSAIGYYNYLRSYWNNADYHLKYGGMGVYGTILADHIFPGDPLDTLKGWTELTAGIEPYNRFTISSTGPWILKKNDFITIDMAFVYGRDFNGNHLTSIPVMKERVKQIRMYYENDSTPCGSILGIHKRKSPVDQITVYPNPAGDRIKIAMSKAADENEYKIIDITGRELLSGRMKNVDPINISSLKSGLYLLFLKSDNQFYHAKFIKVNVY